MNTTIRVDDAGRYQVGWTRNGIDFTPVGEPFAKPRPAIDYSMELEGWGPRPGQERTVAAEPAVGDVPGQPEASALGSEASGTCAGCGGPTPPGRHGQRRITCSVACRQRVARQAAAEQPRADTDGAHALSHLPSPSEAVAGGRHADPTPCVDRDARALPRSTQGVGADLSPGGEPDLLSLGF